MSEKLLQHKDWNPVYERTPEYNVSLVWAALKWDQATHHVNTVMKILVHKNRGFLDQLEGYWGNKAEFTVQVSKETTMMKIAVKRWMGYKLRSFSEYSQVSSYFKRK